MYTYLSMKYYMCLPLVTIGHETVMGKCTFFGTDYDRGTCM